MTDSEYMRKWRGEHPEKTREYARRYYIKNREKILTRQKRQLRGLTSEQKEARRIVTNRWQRADRRRRPGLYAAARLKNTYGLSIDQFDSLLAKQGGCCATCNKKGKLNVDHCHKTDRVRGLLCRSCNFVLGLVDESPRVLYALIRYLKNT